MPILRLEDTERWHKADGLTIGFDVTVEIGLYLGRFTLNTVVHSLQVIRR